MSKHQHNAKSPSNFSSPVNPSDTRMFFPRASVARDPTRKLSYVSCVGSYSSIKMGVQFPFESLPERNAMLLMDVDPLIQYFHAQPATFKWQNGDKIRRYTPDFFVVWTSGKRKYLEIKPEKRILENPSLNGRFDDILRECIAREASFEFWTHEQIRKEPRLSTSKLIRSSVDALDEASIAIVRKALTDVGLPSTLGILNRYLGNVLSLTATMLGMVARGELALDLDADLVPKTVISAGIRL